MAGRRRPFGSLSTRIVVGFVALLAIALLSTLALVRSALLAQFDADVDQRLAGEVEQLEVVIAGGDPDTGEAFTDAEVLFDTHLRQVLPADDDAFFTLVDGDGFLFSFDPPAELLDDSELVDEFAAVERSTFRSAQTDAGTARLLIVPVSVAENDGTFVAAAFTDDARRDLNAVFRLVLVVGGSVLVVTAMIAAALARRATRPIRDLTAVVRSISDADLSARIPTDERADDEIEELAETFNAMMARLERGFISQRRFLDDVAHELRTPITIVQGYLDVLDDDPAHRQETVEVITDELARMNRYVGDLLVLAQAEQPDFVRREAVDLRTLLDGVLRRAAGLGERRWTIDAAAEGSAVLDQQRITQAVLNLCENAVRHTEQGDEIGLGLCVAGDRVVITVRDTGSGIDADLADDLFERHIRGAASRSHGGAGLGLSIVDAIAVAHGGRVSVESTSTEGTTFTIDIQQRPT